MYVYLENKYVCDLINSVYILVVITMIHLFIYP